VAQRDDPRRSRQDGFLSDEEQQQDETAVFHGSEVTRIYGGAGTSSLVFDAPAFHSS